LRRVAIGSCSYHDISMSPYTAKLFKLPSGVPVTRNIRTAYTGDQPVEVMDTISNGEAVSYRFEIQV